MREADAFEIVGMRKMEESPVSARKKGAKMPVISLVILGLIVAGCLILPFVIGKDPSYMDLMNANQAPSRQFLFGTDTMGRDIFTMIWSGGRISLFIGCVSTLISTVIAILFGGLSGIAPQWADTLLMRFTEIFLSIPNLLLVILLQAILGKANVLSVSLVIGVTSWASLAKASPDRGAPDPEQRLCDGVTVHGRKLFSCARAASHAEFSAGDPVYGGYECEERDRGGVHTEFHGHGAAPGDGVLGQHAVAGGEGAADRILVDDNCSRRVPGCDTYGYDGGGAVSSEGT